MNTHISTSCRTGVPPVTAFSTVALKLDVVPKLLLPLLVLTVAVSAPAASSSPAKLAFTASAAGEFQFDTGLLRGTLRSRGKSFGLASVVHVPSGVMLDRGDRGYGLFSHYRVFSSGKRYGNAAWDWPSTARLREDGAVEVRWAAATNRPFEMSAVYRWSGPDTLDLETIVKAQADLPKFESFLASYFGERFTNSLAYVSDPSAKAGPPVFLAADRAAGVWQMFPRDAAAVAVINDGRWQLEPNPVQWTLRPMLARPVAIRRESPGGLGAVLMAPAGDCFAIATPHQTEGHYSVYLSLFGRDLKAGERAQARARLWVSAELSDSKAEEAGRSYPTAAGR